jgi:hypothetical protein
MSGVRINDWRAVVGEGSHGFAVAGLSGVLDGADVRHKTVARAGDGAFGSRTDLDVRIVTIGGLCFSDSPREQRHMSSQLKALQSQRETFRVVFDLGDGLIVSGDAFVSDKPTFEPLVWGETAKWDLELQFDDPTFYGDSRSFPIGTNASPGVSFAAFQYGNEVTYPVYTVDGNFPNGFTINGPGGKKFITTRAVVPGSPHTVDMSDGYLRVNGVLAFGVTTQPDIWGIEPSVSVSQSLTATGSGVMSVSVTDRHN